MTYTVSGMTCGHCVSSVREEVGELDGVTSVEVELASGRLDVTAEQLLDTASVRAAVQEAGYEVITEGATP
jgi:copper ion binding protein